MPRPPLLPGLLLGIGLGGFVDGIVLHQLLQWHHLLTDHGRFPAGTVAGLEGNTVADGLFHLATWLCVAAGATLLVRSWREGRPPPPWRFQVGLLLAGWGLFNLVEGVVDHHILTIHHVRDDVADPLPWDLGFLAFGALLLLAGWALVRPFRPAAPGLSPGAARAPGGGRRGWGRPARG